MDIQLPKYADEILKNHLIPLNPGAKPEMLLLALNIFCSRILCHNRIQIHGYEDKPIYPNLYGLTFSISGSGKDRIVRQLRDCYDEIYKEHDERYEKLRQKKIQEIESLFVEDEKMKKWSKARKEGYIADNSPRQVLEEMSNATPEGFVAMREAFSFHKQGSLHFANSEFIDYIINKTTSKEDILDLLKDCYEFGDNGAKIIKGDKSVKVVKDVPQTMLVFSSVAGLLRNSTANTKLDDFFRRGFARRCFVCFPENGDKKKERPTYKENKALKQSAYNHEKKLAKLLQAAHDYTLPNILLIEHKEIKIIINDEELENYIYQYDCDNQDLADQIPENEAEPFKSILLDNRRKAVRLAGVITIMRNPREVEGGCYKMTIEDYEYARQQVDFYYQQFTKFYNRVSISDAERAYLFIQKMQDIQEITKTLLRNQKFAPTQRSQVSHWLENLLTKELPEYCAIQSTKLTEKSGRNYKHYRIEKPKAVEHKQLPDSIGINNTELLNNFPNFCYQTFDDKGKKKSLAKIIKPYTGVEVELEERNKQGAGIFFTPNQFPDGKRKKEFCAGINAWFVEDDDKELEEQYGSISKGSLEPSIIIKTRNSLHSYWLAAETIKGTADELDKRFTIIQKGLIEYYNGDAACKDTTRVMRLPGYNHNKKEPLMVEVIKYNPELKYTEEQMRENYPYHEEVNKGYTPPKKVQINDSMGFWEALATLDNKTVLQMLSGQQIVNCDTIQFRKRTSEAGTHYIDVNNEIADAWLDASGMIGSGKKGSPTWIQWVEYYGRSKSEIAKWAKDNLSGLVPPEVLNK